MTSERTMHDRNTPLFGLAGWAAYGSAGVSALGVVCIVLLYVGLITSTKALLIFGPINDLCVAIQYLLALPVLVAVQRLTQPQSPRLTVFASTLGALGIAGIIVFQALFLAGLMSFATQLPFASASVLTIGAWILFAGAMGRRGNVIASGVTVDILAALYFGYPVWAYRMGQQLVARTTGPTAA